MALRSQSWYGQGDCELGNIYTVFHRTGMRAIGMPRGTVGEKPIIGICTSWSELTHCNAHLTSVAEAVKRGVWEAGGVPLVFPVISPGEATIVPTAMILRNLLAMDTEELISRQPIDGVVLLCGCDKTTPGMLMGAASADIPAIVVSGGPMLNGNWRGQTIGSGTDVFRAYDQYRLGQLETQDLIAIESCLSRSSGHCMTMGTASTMTCLAEALGMSLPGSASIPAPDSRRLAIAQESGRRIVAMVHEQLRPSEIMTDRAFENAITVLMALGGSTNAVIHLTAIAGRLGITLRLEDFDRRSVVTPVLANLRPSGHYLMEHFYYAGGLPALMREIEDLLHRDALTVSGRTISENIVDATCYDRDVIRRRDQPLAPDGGIVALSGNLAPDGAILKRTAASTYLQQHCGRAVVFANRADLLNRIDDPNLEVDASSVLVLQNAGPRGAPGMPEWGQLPIPKKLLEQGVTDMVRLSDGRMSGTSYGTVVLHVAPEAALGGPLAIVRDGDIIELDVAARRLHLHVDDAEIAARRAEWRPPAHHYERGYGWLFEQHVLQANQGCDFDFLRYQAGGSQAELAVRQAAAGHG